MTKTKKSADKKSPIDVFRSDGRDLTLITDKGHHLYDPRVEGPPLDPTLVDKIDRLGWTHGAIKVVRETLEDGTTRNSVEDGKQRTKALLIVNAKRAKKGEPLVEALVEAAGAVESADTADGHYKQFMGMFVSNQGATRENPLMEAKKLRAMLKLAEDANIPEKTAIRDAAVILGDSVETVKQRLTALKACKEAQKKFEEGRYSFSDLLTLGRLPEEKQVKAMKEIPDREEGRARRPKTTKKAGDRIKGKGKVRPTSKVIARYIETMGDGHKATPFMQFCGGFISEAKFQKLTGLKPA